MTGWSREDGSRAEVRIWRQVGSRPVPELNTVLDIRASLLRIACMVGSHSRAGKMIVECEEAAASWPDASLSLLGESERGGVWSGDQLSQPASTGLTVVSI